MQGMPKSGVCRRPVVAASVGSVGGLLEERKSARHTWNFSLTCSTGSVRSGAIRSLAGEITRPALCSKCGSVTRIMPI